MLESHCWISIKASVADWSILSFDKASKIILVSMSIQDLNTFAVAIPNYRYNPTPELIQCLQGLEVKLERQIWVGSSDVKHARNGCVNEFFTPAYADSNVLVFVDQDTVPRPQDFQALVSFCSEKNPIVGSNMVYRQSNVPNWFLFDDPEGIKKNEIISNPEFNSQIIRVKWIGFGMVALHRTALEKMADKVGFSAFAGQSVPTLFNEYRLRHINLTEKQLEEVIKKQYKPESMSQEEFNKYFDEKLKDSLLFVWHNKFPSQILPETYSFCERAHDLGLPIDVMLGVTPGHLDQVVRYVEQYLPSGFKPVKLEAQLEDIPI